MAGQTFPFRIFCCKKEILFFHRKENIYNLQEYKLQLTSNECLLDVFFHVSNTTSCGFALSHFFVSVAVFTKHRMISSDYLFCHVSDCQFLFFPGRKRFMSMNKRKNGGEENYYRLNGSCVPFNYFNSTRTFSLELQWCWKLFPEHYIFQVLWMGTKNFPFFPYFKLQIIQLTNPNV